MAPLAPPVMDMNRATELLGEPDRALKGKAGASELNIEYVPRTVVELSEEARHTENLIRSVEQTLGDPQTSLGEAMRLTNWSKQLEAYLHGIRFALGETKSCSARERQTA